MRNERPLGTPARPFQRLTSTLPKTDAMISLFGERRMTYYEVESVGRIGFDNATDNVYVFIEFAVASGGSIELAIRGEQISKVVDAMLGIQKRLSAEPLQ